MTEKPTQLPANGAPAQMPREHYHHAIRPTQLANEVRAVLGIELAADPTKPGAIANGYIDTWTKRPGNPAVHLHQRVCEYDPKVIDAYRAAREANDAAGIRLIANGIVSSGLGAAQLIRVRPPRLVLAKRQVVAEDGWMETVGSVERLDVEVEIKSDVCPRCLNPVDRALAHPCHEIILYEDEKAPNAVIVEEAGRLLAVAAPGARPDETDWHLTHFMPHGLSAARLGQLHDIVMGHRPKGTR